MNLTQQVAGFGESLQYHLGTKTKCSQHDTIQHQIACIMVDLFMFSDYLDADLEKECLAAIKWFRTGIK
jgi:hypothetical protein